MGRVVNAESLFTHGGGFFHLLGRVMTVLYLSLTVEGVRKRRGREGERGRGEKERELRREKREGERKPRSERRQLEPKFLPSENCPG